MAGCTFSHSAAADEACLLMKAGYFRGSPAFTQLALADFLDRGELERHLRRTHAVYRFRRDALVGGADCAIRSAPDPGRR